MTEQTITIKTNGSDKRYGRFFHVVDQLVEEVAELGQRRPKSTVLDNHQHSVGLLVRDSVAVILRRKRVSPASIQLNLISRTYL